MSLPESIYREHGYTSFGFWPEEGGEFACVIFDTPFDTYAGLLNREGWKIAERESPAFKEATAAKALIRFKTMKILSEGWFAFSKVEFVCVDGRRFVGKTDKGFAKFLSTRVPPH